MYFHACNINTMASTNYHFLMTMVILQILIVFMIKISNSTRVINTTNFPSAILIFGDSTVDTGNNNYIKTLFKGNFYPYGQDFPGKIPTGRFSNGKLVPDFVASMLGIKEMVPPFLDPTLSDDELLTGVSFASAGSGFDDLTTLASNVFPVSRQIDLFRDYIKRIKGIVGDETAKEIINKALVIISAGANDFIFNFYDLPSRRFEYTISGYQDFLLGRLQFVVKELYDFGCRTMVISGLPPIGCLPIQMTAKFEYPLKRKCLEDQNSDAESYNQKLEKLLNQMEALLPSSIIVYADTYEALIDMIHHPQKYGFVETKRGCCGTGLIEAAILCNPTTPTCINHSNFLFWDSIHPTQSAYQYLAQNLQFGVQKLLYNHSR